MITLVLALGAMIATGISVYLWTRMALAHADEISGGVLGLLQHMGEGLLTRGEDEKRKSPWAFRTQWNAWLALDPDQKETSVATELGKCVIFAVIGLVIGLFFHPLLAMGLAAVLGATPLLLLRSTIREIRQQVDDSLPNMIVLLTAETESGANAANTFVFLSRLPGPLPTLCGKLHDLAQYENRSLFSTVEAQGVVVPAVQQLQHPTLGLSFAMFEQVSLKGAQAAGSLRQVNEMLLQTRTRQLEIKGKRLETVMSVVLFFFIILPFLAMILAPAGLTIMNAL